MGSAILQIVAVWRGRIVGYRLLTKRRKITIGSHTGATFMAPMTDGRKRYVLIKPSRGGYTLRLAPNLRGEVQTGGETRDVMDILASPPGRRDKGALREVALTTGDRAKLYFAENPDLRIELRWVDPPEVLAKPKVEDPMMFQTLVGTSLVLGLAAALLVSLYRRAGEQPLCAVILAELATAKIEAPILEIEKKNTAAAWPPEKRRRRNEEEGQMKKAKEKANKLERC